MNAVDSEDESDHDFISTKMLAYTRDIIQSHTNVNQIEACYEIGDHITQIKSEWKGALKTM